MTTFTTESLTDCAYRGDGELLNGDGKGGKSNAIYRITRLFGDRHGNASVLVGFPVLYSSTGCFFLY